MTQEELWIQKAAGGDQEAFAALVASHEKMVYTLTVRIMGNPHDGEEAAQEAFLAAWRGLPFFKGFLQMIQLPLTKLSELEKALPLFPGHMCVIDVRPDRKNPQYTMTYVDRYLGMGNVADYLKPPAQPAAQDDLIPVD